MLIWLATRTLDIKELKTFYNERLDMGETVGAYFDDRRDPDNKSPSTEPPSNSIVRVYRYPPDPEELMSSVRYGSLMPESTARPRKRPHADSSRTTQDSLLAVASVEDRDDNLPNKARAVPSKRQRTQEAQTNQVFGLGRMNPPQRHRDGSIRVTPRPVGAQSSSHQVCDSQGSAAGKRTLWCDQVMHR